MDSAGVGETMSGAWLVDETADNSRIADAASAEPGSGAFFLRPPPDELAVRLHELHILNNKKFWNLFKGADLRLDTIVTHALVPGGVDVADLYVPTTFRFPNVQDHSRLPIDPDTGLLIFLGYPTHFLDISIIASRDTKDSDDLAELISTELNSEAFKQATASILALTAVAPGAGVIAAAIGGAAVLGNIAYKVVRSLGTNTIGIYRGSWLEIDHLGVGTHPKDGGAYKADNLEFWYDVVVNET